MDSQISRPADRELVAATQRLSPEERVNAFLEHCRLVMEIRDAASKMKAQHTRRDV